MKKRILIAVAIFLSAAVLIVAAASFLTEGFTRGLLSRRIYRPQNVYEEIWNLMLTEKTSGTKTILTTGTEDAYEDWDLGIDFVGIYIPSSNASIHLHSLNKGRDYALVFRLWIDGQKSSTFVYDYQTKTLSADADSVPLMEHFLADYFAWCEADPDFDSDYSAEDLGDFTFRHESPVLIHF